MAGPAIAQISTNTTESSQPPRERGQVSAGERNRYGRQVGHIDRYSGINFGNLIAGNLPIAFIV
ncbi:hypothetical protein [Mesorhizobium sp.]|uniref:hypothetical protein n=1 Tax=Mesorhizobium sp. TaxID=1871066 RepID=UPI001218F403|nr:hypothetical protein [Mesorhizobium sp.]TIO10278.1 MAG: hypothetical protein E5X88_04070 [Mesorhizobium sp.]TIO36619.1 MAG: hypothetical protein E5X89_01015 [Mesorhizobium sp.]